MQPLQVIKPSTQSVTSSTVLVNDTALAIPVSVASAQYNFEAFFLYQGGTGGASDLKLQWNVPAGATLNYAIAGLGSGGGNLASNAFISGTPAAVRTNGAGNLLTAVLSGTLIMGVTTGTLQLQWAQNNSSGTSTQMMAGSSAELMRVS